MQEQATRQITVMLDHINGGREGAFTELVHAVYTDLKRISAKAMAQSFEQPLEGLTRPPTEIAHDAIMELRRQKAEWVNRDQFFAIATKLIFRLVHQYRRDRKAIKRGGGHRGVAMGLPGETGSIEPADDATESNADTSGALGALEKLHAAYPRNAEAITLTVVCGLTQKEAASMLDISEVQLQRDVRFGKAWLKDAMAARPG